MHIVVPIDSSAHSEKTLSKACEYAAEKDAHMTILQVMEPPPMNFLFTYNYADVVADIRADKDEFFMSMKPMLEVAGVEWDRKIESGLVEEKIVNYTKQDDVDMLIMGSRPKSMLQRFFSRPLSERVMGNAECDVMLVK